MDRQGSLYHRALDGEIRLESRCRRAEDGRLRGQWGAMNLNFHESGKDMISCHDHILGGPCPFLN